MWWFGKESFFMFLYIFRGIDHKFEPCNLVLWICENSLLVDCSSLIENSCWGSNLRSLSSSFRMLLIVDDRESTSHTFIISADEVDVLSQRPSLFMKRSDIIFSFHAKFYCILNMRLGFASAADDWKDLEWCLVIISFSTILFWYLLMLHPLWYLALYPE